MVLYGKRSSSLKPYSSNAALDMANVWIGALPWSKNFPRYNFPRRGVPKILATDFSEIESLLLFCPWWAQMTPLHRFPFWHGIMVKSDGFNTQNNWIQNLQHLHSFLFLYSQNKFWDRFTLTLYNFKHSCWTLSTVVYENLCCWFFDL